MARRPRAVLTKPPTTDALPSYAAEAAILGRFIIENEDLLTAERVGHARRSDAASPPMAVGERRRPCGKQHWRELPRPDWVSPLTKKHTTQYA